MTHELRTPSPENNLPSLEEVYAQEINSTVNTLVANAHGDHLLLEAAEAVQQRAATEAVATGVQTVHQKITSQARFYASNDASWHRALTGMSRQRDDSLFMHQQREELLTAYPRTASEANLQACQTVDRFIRAQQPKNEVTEPWSHTGLEKGWEPVFTEGPNTAYQVTSIGTNIFGDKLTALVTRPVTIEDGRPVNNKQYPSVEAKDYSAEQIQNAHAAIKCAWQDDGAGDSYRIHSQPTDEISDELAVRVMYASERHLDETVETQRLPRWWDGNAIALVPAQQS